MITTPCYYEVDFLDTQNRFSLNLQMKLYRVRNWEKLYENNRTRELKRMDWVPVPNKHDGDSFTSLMAMPDGIALFGAWNLILQVASKCDPRGTLLRDGKKPHDSASLSRITRAPEKVIVKALQVFSSDDIKWLDVDTCDNPAGGCDNPAPECGNPAGGCLEGKGREGNGIEVKEQSPSADRFNVPTLEEVKLGFSKTGLPSSEADKFFHFYESKGWMVGKNKMKSLNGAIGGWAARYREGSKPATVTTTPNNDLSVPW